MDEEMVLLQRLDDGVALVTLNTPPLNLMSVRLNHRLYAVLEEIEQDDAIRVVVLTGAGEKCFSAGADVKEFARFVKAGTLVSEKLKFECEVLNRLEGLPQPTIAALNGIVLGGGIEMALCCDYRILAQEVSLGFPEIGLGLFPGSGGLVRLPQLVGKTKAKELMLFGERLSAQEALDIGLVNEIRPKGEVLERALERARSLSKMPRQSLRAIKKGVNDVCTMPTIQGVAYSLGLMSQVLTTDDAQEGVNAFLEKRDPRFNRCPQGGNGKEKSL